MVTILSLSPAIDRRLEFDGFRVRGTNRVLASREEGAGKAVGVALAAAAMGLPARLIGLLPSGGGPVTGRLTRNGAPFAFRDAPGTVRVNLKLYDRTSGETTEVNEPCPRVPPALRASVEEDILRAAKESRFLVLTGCLGVGFPKDFYACVVRRVRQQAPGCRCVVDADGDSLEAALASRPFLVKPNLAEFSHAVGRPLATRGAVVAAGRELLTEGPEVLVVSMGAEGVVALTAETVLYVPAATVPVNMTTGAGDAMVAGLIKGFCEKGTLLEALRHGTAAAAARCMDGGDGFLRREDYRGLLSDATAYPV